MYSLVVLCETNVLNLISQWLDTICQIKPKRATIHFSPFFQGTKHTLCSKKDLKVQILLSFPNFLLKLTQSPLGQVQSSLFGTNKTLVSQLSHLAPEPTSFFMVTRNLASSTKIHNSEWVHVLCFSFLCTRYILLALIQYMSFSNHVDSSNS
jgi:hypothetical protein